MHLYMASCLRIERLFFGGLEQCDLHTYWKIFENFSLEPSHLLIRSGDILRKGVIFESRNRPLVRTCCAGAATAPVWSALHEERGFAGQPTNDPVSVERRSNRLPRREQRAATGLHTAFCVHVFTWLLRCKSGASRVL